MNDTTPERTVAPGPVPPVGAGSLLERLSTPNALVLFAAVLFVICRYASIWPSLGIAFTDTDDVMRLVEIRDYLAGQGWFDLHQYRLDPPAGDPMHWSRLVDVGFAAIDRLAELVVPPGVAEKIAMFLWPPLTLLPALLFARSVACRLGGPFAALPLVYLFIGCLPVLAQFVPGRIDHHNVQITLTLALLALLFAPTSMRRALGLGATMAAMTAIGMETLPFLLVVAGGLALHWVIDGTRARDTALWGLSLAVSTSFFAVATLPPSELVRGACDALSANYLALAVAGGLGLVFATRLAGATVGARLAALGLVAAVALAAFAWPESRCLAGPFADVHADAREIWLDHVGEVQPWLTIARDHPIAGVSAVVMPLLAPIAAGLLFFGRAERRADPAVWVLVVMALAAFGLGLFQVRTLVYAGVFGCLLVAAAIGDAATAAARRGRSPVVVVLAASLFLSSSFTALMMQSWGPPSWSGPQTTDATAPAVTGSGATSGDACMTTTSYRELAKLPPGLVAAEIDDGPVILAATPHAVLSAPYHRMQRGIVDANHILYRAPEEALVIIDDRRVDYVVHCASSRKSRVAVLEAAPGGLLAGLLRGELGSRFEEIPGNPAIRVFRVRPKSAFADATP